MVLIQGFMKFLINRGQQGVVILISRLIAILGFPTSIIATGSRICYLFGDLEKRFPPIGNIGISIQANDGVDMKGNYRNQVRLEAVYVEVKGLKFLVSKVHLP